MKFTLISAVNNESVLNSCLLSSPCASRAEAVLLRRGFRSAALAYNAAIEEARTDVVVLVHQDVFLPEGWDTQMERALQQLEQEDPHWAVAGIWGVMPSGEGTGYLYCAGLARTLGQEFSRPVAVRTIDEALLVLRKSSGLRFDEAIPGYHLYGTDLCLQAEARGMKCYALAAFCIHNTNGYDLLPWDFWKCYFLLRKKWRTRLPVITPCTEITLGCWPMIHWNGIRLINLLLRRHKAGRRVVDPASLYQQISRNATVPAVR
jgi:hypothetical protein